MGGARGGFGDARLGDDAAQRHVGLRRGVPHLSRNALPAVDRGACGLLASAAAAAPPADRDVSPDGLWLTVDDRSGEPRSKVRISVEDGRLRGTVERIHAREGESTDPVCNRCDGPRRGARVVGLVILWGHVARGSWTSPFSFFGWGG